MKLNVVLTVLVAFFSYLIMAGLLTQIGILIDPMSKYFEISLPTAASLFSFLNIGCLVGTFVAMVIFDKMQIKTIFQIFYTPMVFAVILMFFTKSEVVTALCLAVLGLSCGVGLSAGAVIIAKTFSGGHRASAFLGTDCAFSAAGAIFPAITTYIIASNISWQNGLLVVMIPVVAILVLTFFLSFPETRLQKIAEVQHVEVQKVNIFTPRVFIAGLAVGLYLLCQQSYITWAPTYLKDYFGASTSDASLAISRYWSLSVFGLITAAILVNKISPRIVLIIVTALGTMISLSLCLAPSADVFLTIAFVFGFCTTCTYKIGISIGSEQIKNAPARLVTFLLVCGTVGSTLGPIVSSQVVAISNSRSAMFLSCLLFATVLCLFLILLTKERQANKRAWQKD